MRALNKWDRHKSRTTHDKEVRGVQWYQNVSLCYTSEITIKVISLPLPPSLLFLNLLLFSLSSLSFPIWFPLSPLLLPLLLPLPAHCPASQAECPPHKVPWAENEHRRRPLVITAAGQSHAEGEMELYEVWVLSPCTCGMRSGNESMHLWYGVWEWVHAPVVWSLGMSPCTCGMGSGNESMHLWYEVWEWVHTLMVWSLGMGSYTCGMGSGNRFPNHMSTNDNVCLPSVLRIWVELSRSMRLWNKT